ncbi:MULTISPECIES: nucleotide exchange factor GrpE [unclassified Arsukibacterium]|uniref:nucleotide exchange factor GrpE n=1 Tax=unclassified Arsukibacterium TaxID=2635278 RepID=UPI000C5F85C5|nr:MULTISPECIES: nucleotide exchange factor GrpE [unclassified Arsukibacterium]MAA94207.1 nucleotide exchange factor GrpE [Rheinheimera sp.]MBM34458.1 nucleotide exchange factor GrpE [Rheinheimera sp.]HAW93970.1 nucleotide exchange factor GrpE [Candidatus Azambacteria bacterium]|tara:strand:- start:3907 stop:4500 length:594 start_codon:yes stop_codon:yes gene_type:complete
MTEQAKPNEQAEEIKQDNPNQESQANDQADTVELSGEQAVISKLETELAQAQAKLADQQDLMLRIKADAENARRRASQDVEKAHKFALEKFAGDLLPVVDNLERALAFINREDEAFAGIIEGVELTMKSFLDTVAKYGVQQIDPQGEPFNPDQHQAMTIQPSADVAPNTVTFVMQKGYELNGRLLRPAMVGVSKAPE